MLQATLIVQSFLLEGGPGSGRRGHKSDRGTVPYADRQGAGLDSFSGEPVDGPLDFSGKPAGKLDDDFDRAWAARDLGALAKLTPAKIEPSTKTKAPGTRKVGKRSDESWVDQGKKKPAGMKSTLLYTAQAMLSHAPLLRKKKVLAKPVDDQVPVASFVDDVKRKMKLKHVMQHTNEALPGRLETKEDVNYRYAENPERSCGKCTHFLFPGACDMVAGLIRYVDVCNEFEAKDNVAKNQAAPTVQATFVDSAKKESAVPGTDEHAALLSGQGWQFHANDHDTIVYTNPETDEEIRVWDSGNWIRYTADQHVVAQGQGVESLRQDLSAHETEGGPGSGPQKGGKKYPLGPGTGSRAANKDTARQSEEGGPGSGRRSGDGKGEKQGFEIHLKDDTGRDESYTVVAINKKDAIDKAKAEHRTKRPDAMDVKPTFIGKSYRYNPEAEGGPGSGRRPGGKTIYAKAEPASDEDRQIGTFTRREKPGERRQRIKDRPVDPATAKAIQKALLVVRASLVTKNEAMSTMGSHVAISDVPGSDSQDYTAPGLKHGRRGAA